MNIFCSFVFSISNAAVEYVSILKSDVCRCVSSPSVSYGDASDTCFRQKVCVSWHFLPLALYRGVVTSSRSGRNHVLIARDYIVVKYYTME